MRSPAAVLQTLASKAQNVEYQYERLYRNLYNPEFYLLAYKNIASSQGSMTAGVDGRTLDGMSIGHINRIIASIKNHSYQPNPARRKYIPKKNNPTKKRPLGIPSTDDKLVQEVVRMLLEAIYEPNFSPTSHGFRPNRSCHTALIDISNKFIGVTWFIEGDIKACFDSFDHHVLIGILRRRIHDESFIELIWKFLRAGYMEQWSYCKTYSGTPQGSGMSPLLANIYLSEMDNFICHLKENFDCKASNRKPTKEYKSLTNRQAYRRKKYYQAIAEGKTEQAKEELRAVKGLQREKLATQCTPTMDLGYRKLCYNRYADDFIIGIIGSQKDAKNVKEAVGSFLSETLKLTLSQDKTHITHSSDKIRYLGYDICVSKDRSTRYIQGGFPYRSRYGKVRLYMPAEKWQEKLREYKAFTVIIDKNRREQWKPRHRGELINLTELEIVNRYNSEIRGIYNYYRIATNVSSLNNFYGIMRRSLHKTFAAKYKTKTRKIRDRYIRDDVFRVNYLTKTGWKQREFYHEGFCHNPIPAPGWNDVLPDFRKYNHHNSLAARLKRGSCELCGKTTDEIIMHHVRRLKDLTGATPWEVKMMDIRRKSLAVCPDCFQVIQLNSAH